MGYIGQSLKMTCIGINISPPDIVWIVYTVANPFDQRVIYSDSNYIGNSSRKYSIESEIISESLIGTSLTIYDVQESDELYGYQCVCNIYKRCSNTNHAKANATIVALMLTTTSNIFNSRIKWNPASINPENSNRIIRGKLTKNKLILKTKRNLCRKETLKIIWI